MIFRPSNYRKKLRCHACDTRTESGKWCSIVVYQKPQLRISSPTPPPVLQRANSVLPYVKPRRRVCDFPMRDAAIDQDLGEHLPVFATNLFLQRVSSQNTILT